VVEAYFSRIANNAKHPATARLIRLAFSKLMTIEEDATEHTIKINGNSAEPLAKYMPVCLLRNLLPATGEVKWR